jgi:amino acid adenylation domain-containing protein
MDGWSLAVLIGEIEETYNALRSGRAPSLAPAESFRAYVLAERKRRAGNAAQVEYWRGVYADPPAPLELTRDRARTQQENFEASTDRHVFAEDLTAKLRAEARRRGVTMYALLLAGFARFLARLSGQRDFAIGIPFAGQALAGSGALIGDGVNTLPLRLRARDDEDFGALVAKAQAALMDAAENQDLTMLNVMRALGPRSRDALGRVIFNLNPRLRDPAFEGVATRWQDCRHAALLWDLFFNLNDNGRTLALDLHYRTSLYDAQTIRKWMGEFECVLAMIVEPQERSATVVTEMPMSRERATLLDLVDTQVRRTPDRVAIECGPEKLTYSELWSRSGALASTLIERGVARGEIVGVCLPRRPEMLIGLLGVLRAGAAYVPLDAGFPDQRLITMIEQAQLRRTIVFDGEDLPAAVRERGGEMIAVTRTQDARAENLPSIRGEDLAYVLFTSGSTGTPKGVRVLHRNLASFLAAMLDEPGLAADDVLCAVTTLSFDIAGLELYLPLTIGARVLLATENEVHDPHALTRLIRESHATVLQTTPTLLRLLVEGAGANAVGGLKLMVGGEALPRDLAEAVLPHCSALWNMYGPTETTIWSALARVSAGQGAVPLGRPIAGTRIYVLDEQGKPVADGVHGEIWIGGEGVADGYLGRADLTAERFRPDPFAVAGASMYRTGDIGSLQQGILHFHGRNDDQIKLRGFRVELGDVEAAAAADPSVREAAAVLHSFGEHDSRIVLYVTTRSDDSEIATRLRHSLRDALPPYMRPQHIEVLATMPKTPNGKIDRKALPSPFVPAAVVPPAPQTPGDSHSDYLAAIWREIIGVDDVRAADNFFELGGDSLLAVDMMARVERDTGVRLTVLAIATGTLESLSQTIGRGVASANRGWFARLRSAIGGTRGR